MQVYFSQIYIEAGADYPFSVHWQRAMHEFATKRLEPSKYFAKKYAPDYKIVFNVSAKSSLVETETVGPAHFKKDKDVEYTLFLPFDRYALMGPELYSQVMKRIFESASKVLHKLEIDTALFDADADAFIESVVSSPKMIEDPR